ncbi:MAG: HAD-IA family hydrolase [Burkholderiaceae bacterium]
MTAQPPSQPSLATNPDLQTADWPMPVPRADWRDRWTAQSRRAVLFDLDGTLLDTAADLGGVANTMRENRGLPALPISELRPYASKGARGMLQKALGVEWNAPEFEALRTEFLDIYQQDLSRHTRFMPDLELVIADLEARHLPWGIVTNKYERFTHPLLRDLRLDKRAAVTVCGDTTPFAKPHPQPLKHAIGLLGLPAEAVIYVGDDFRDVQSGFNAGCYNIAAAFGFCSSDRPVADWGADAIAHQGKDLLELLAD